MDQIHLSSGMASSVEIRQHQAEENPWNFQYWGSVCCGRMVGGGWHKGGPTPKEKTKVPGQKRGLKVDTMKSPYTGPGFLLAIKDPRQKPSPAEQEEAAWAVRSAAPGWALEYPELGRVWWQWRRSEETQEFTCWNWTIGTGNVSTAGPRAERQPCVFSPILAAAFLRVLRGGWHQRSTAKESLSLYHSIPKGGTANSAWRRQGSLYRRWKLKVKWRRENGVP